MLVRTYEGFSTFILKLNKLTRPSFYKPNTKET